MSSRGFHINIVGQQIVIVGYFRNWQVDRIDLDYFLTMRMWIGSGPQEEGQACLGARMVVEKQRGFIVGMIDLLIMAFKLLFFLNMVKEKEKIEI